MKRYILVLVVLLLVVGAYLAGTLNRRSNILTNRDTKKPIEAKTASPEIDEDPSSTPFGSVRITPEKQQMIGLVTGPIEKKSLTHSIRLLGRVAADETRTYVINATVDGWIIRTLPNSTGSYVKKNEVLATFYSSEFLSGVQALLYALGAMDKVQTTGREIPARKDQITQFNLGLQQYTDSLRNLGMGDVQIEKLIKDREWVENVDITSPADGFILIRNVSDGLRFTKGSEMYRIADLSRIWILADVFEQEAQYFKPGMKANVILPYQKKTYQATVSKVLPVFDASTRTLKVRLEVDNPGFTLRPDMFVDVEMPVQTLPAITVPSTAILFTGQSKTVFVDRGNGYFEPRKVETGWRLGDRVEITGGLMPGEKIVLSGNFFIDSESRLQSAAQGVQGPVSLDPVCGMEVEEARAKAEGKTSLYQGKTYYFCNLECKAQFDRNPSAFLRKPSQVAGSPTGKEPSRQSGESHPTGSGKGH